ncbi:unnamed protein product [Victoria cruziana]
MSSILCIHSILRARSSVVWGEGAAKEPLALEGSERKEDPRKSVDLGSWTGDNVKFKLLPELTKNIMFLECEAPGGVCQIYLIRTAHVSKLGHTWGSLKWDKRLKLLKILFQEISCSNLELTDKIDE